MSSYFGNSLEILRSTRFGLAAKDLGGDKVSVEMPADPPNQVRISILADMELLRKFTQFGEDHGAKLVQTEIKLHPTHTAFELTYQP